MCHGHERRPFRLGDKKLTNAKEKSGTNGAFPGILIDTDKDMSPSINLPQSLSLLQVARNSS